MLALRSPRRRKPLKGVVTISHGVRLSIWENAESERFSQIFQQIALIFLKKVSFQMKAKKPAGLHSSSEALVEVWDKNWPQFLF